MSLNTVFTIAALAALHAAAVVAKPTVHAVSTLTRMPLNNAANMSVCPMNVTLDVDPARVPKVIKIIKCAESAESAESCPCNEDGRHKHHSCVELYDDVLVYYRNGATGQPDLKTVRKTVPVGCVCMLRRHVEGWSTPPPALS